MWNGAHYDKVADPQAKWGESVIERLDLAPNSVVLDAGCGSGRVTEALLRKHSSLVVVALDASESMLATARERLAGYGERVQFIHASLAADFSWRDPVSVAFDAVISTGTFHWVPNHEGLFRRIFKTLRPGGQFVAQFGGHGSVASVRDLLDQFGIDWRSYNNYADQTDTERALIEAGFESVCCWAHEELVEFSDMAALVGYLEFGVLSPYVAHLNAQEQSMVAHRVANNLGELALRFVRMNIVAQRPQ
jgi:trans-aconitate 2-methyltransferase